MKITQHPIHHILCLQDHEKPNWQAFYQYITSQGITPKGNWPLLLNQTLKDWRNYVDLHAGKDNEMGYDLHWYDSLTQKMVDPRRVDPQVHVTNMYDFITSSFTPAFHHKMAIITGKATQPDVVYQVVSIDDHGYDRMASEKSTCVFVDYNTAVLNVLSLAHMLELGDLEGIGDTGDNGDARFIFSSGVDIRIISHSVGAAYKGKSTYRSRYANALKKGFCESADIELEKVIKKFAHLQKVHIDHFQSMNITSLTPISATLAHAVAGFRLMLNWISGSDVSLSVAREALLRLYGIKNWHHAVEMEKQHALAPVMITTTRSRTGRLFNKSELIESYHPRRDDHILLSSTLASDVVDAWCYLDDAVRQEPDMDFTLSVDTSLNGGLSLQLSCEQFSISVNDCGIESAEVSTILNDFSDMDPNDQIESILK